MILSLYSFMVYVLGHTCMVWKGPLKACMTLGKVPLRGLLMYVKNNASD